METRASYVLVGLFVLLSFFAGLGYIAWIADRSDSTEMKRYLIYFDGNVMGLTNSSQVYFNGVYIGKVDTIRLRRDLPGEVEVSVLLDENAPVRTDSIATLEMRGLTGQSVVLISGGTPGAPLLASKSEGKDIPVIRSAPNKLQSLVTSLPGVLAATKESLDRINILLGQGNQESIQNSLNSLEKLTARLAEGGDNIAKILEDLSSSSRAFNSAASNFNTYLKNDLGPATRSFDKTMRNADAFLASANPLMEQISNEGMDEFRRTLIDARQLLNTLNRVLTRLESDPRRFFFGNPVPEYPAR